MSCKRVNLRKNKYDIYIGRSKDPIKGKWGNPFSYKEGTLAQFKTSSRKESIDKHKEWFLNNEILLNDIKELKDKILGCFCKEDETCHGDIIVECVNNLERKLF